jgi:N-methylhydantoinase A/oxoprolinase/acetone carboxylase beta subunit/N-methylhydantoinase B/oxoprolinase/acetone carboxylase alpha subunit
VLLRAVHLALINVLHAFVQVIHKGFKMAYQSIAVDIGGTFTDVSLLRDDGTVEAFKVSSNPASPATAVHEALNRASTALAESSYVMHATTAGTNALLQRSTPPIVLVTTAGFRDVLQIRRTTWSSATPYALDWSPTPPLVSRDRIFEIGERIGADGQIVRPLADSELDRLVAWISDLQPATIAVCLVNSYANPTHEEQIGARISQAFPEIFVTLSSDVLPERGEYERTSTTVIHAALKPVLSEYVGNLESVLVSNRSARLLVMQSNGGLATSRQVINAPGNAVESGPAAGALFAATVARSVGLKRAIALDMGGTTAKACLLEEGRTAETSQLHVGGEMHSGGLVHDPGGYVLRGRAVDLTEVGAGGGSLCRVDAQGVLHVGPESAGAKPGPAAYGAGGEIPTVTDAVLVLGFLEAGTVSDVHLDRDRAREAIRKYLAEPLGVSIEEAAWLVFQVANSNMMRAIHAVSTSRGRDPANYTLIAFGGGGPTHALSIAAALGMTEVLIPDSPDVFSAIGLHTCSVLRDLLQPFSCGIESLDPAALDREFVRLEAQARAEFHADELPLSSTRRMFDARFAGQDRSLTIDLPVTDPASIAERMRDAFVQAHRLEYGHANEEAHVEIVAIRLRADAGIGDSRIPTSRATPGTSSSTAPAYFGPEYGWIETARIPKSALVPHETLHGPVLIQMAQSTVVVPPECSGSLDDIGQIRLTVSAEQEVSSQEWHGRSGLKVFSNGLGAALDRMAFTIAQTAYSNIVTDAHDFSVGLVGADGRVVDQGIGIPLHLSSASSAVTAIGQTGLWPLKRGDMILLNDPYHGGTHLPDLIVLAPVYVDDTLLAHTIAIAHMPDIGSSFTGSWPIGAISLLQEGLVIPPVRLYIDGEMNTAVQDIIRRNVRHAGQVMGDLHALIAATNIGASELTKLAYEYGVDRTMDHMNELIEYAAERTHDELLALGSGEATFTDYIDDDGISPDPIPITVTIKIADGRVWIDFAGTAEQRLAGVNATLSSTMSSIQQCVRTLLSHDLPDNAGFYSKLHVIAEPGTVVNASNDMPVASRAVASSRVADALYGALAKIFPGQIWAAGTGRVALGFSGRHANGIPFYMTDLYGSSTGGRPWSDAVEGARGGGSRNASVEAQEARYPIRITDYAFIPDTGGRGRFRGGNSILRGWEVLADDTDVVIRPDRHRLAPWGLEGGEPGVKATVTLIRPDGEQSDVTRMCIISVRKGDRLVVRTASGGGYGNPADRDSELIERDIREGRVTRNVGYSPDAAEDA